VLSNRFRRLPRWLAAWLCLFIPVLAGCGDVCLFCGDGGGGGGGNGNGTTTLCDRPFPGAGAFVQVDTIDTFAQQESQDDRLSLAVIPNGMSFEYGTSKRTAQPGDLLLADPQASSIYVYEYPSKTRQTLLTGSNDVTGLALLHQEIATGTYADFLFFTVKADNTLYIYDLTGSADPVPITNQLLKSFFGGSDFFESPTALAVSADAAKAVVFVLNDNGTNSSVRRLYVNLTTGAPASPLTIGTMTESSRRLVDLAYYHETDALFVSKKTEGEELAVGWVYRIVNASDRTGSVNLNPDSTFISGSGAPTGLTAAFTNTTGTTADLLVLTEGDGRVLQYDISSGGNAVDFFLFGAVSQFPVAIAYDCTHRRLVVTDVPFNVDFVRTVFEAFPSQ
jgi:hypothetical protein